jgi:hypothetical protein
VDEEVRSVVALTQAVAGGVVQVTPAQGSPVHAPAAHPFAHIVSVEAYEQVPAPQVPPA